MRVLSLAAVTIAFAAVACTEATKPVATGPSGPSFEISDGAHGGNPFFNFLPPMTANPGHGKNVRNLAAVVDICAWDGSACTTALAHFTTDRSTTTTTQRGRPETVRDDRDHYIVNWHTDAFNLEVGGTYRVCVSVGGQALGHADLEVVGRKKDLKNVSTDEYVGLLDDRTLPIKFRIETGALEQAPDAGCGTAPPTISGTVIGPLAGVGAIGYAVYLLDPTGATELALTYTDGNGAYTFTSTSTSEQLVAGTHYLVCEANPRLNFPLDPFAVTETKPVSGGLCPASIDPGTGAPVYAKFGYSVVAPASGDVGGNDFGNYDSGTVPGTISGRVLTYFRETPSSDPVIVGVSGYPVYLFRVDIAGNPTGLPAEATTGDNGLYTFTTTSDHLVAGTSYLVCEANPWLILVQGVETTPTIGGGLCNALFDPEHPDPGTSGGIAQWGYPVKAPASDAPGVGGNNFINQGAL